MNKLNLVSQFCGLALLSIGSAQANIILSNANAFIPTLGLTPSTQLFDYTHSTPVTFEESWYFLVDITPNTDNVLHLSLTPLSAAWDFNDPFTLYGGNHFGVENAIGDALGVFLDPNKDGTYELYAGNGTSLNPDVILSTQNLGFGAISDNQFQMNVGFQPHVPGTSATVSFQIAGSLAAVPAAVPVPTAAWLMLSGLMGALGMSKSRKQNALPA